MVLISHVSGYASVTSPIATPSLLRPEELHPVWLSQEGTGNVGSDKARVYVTPVGPGTATGGGVFDPKLALK